MTGSLPLPVCHPFATACGEFLVKKPGVQVPGYLIKGPFQDSDAA